MNKLLSFALLAIILISNGIIFSQIELPEDKVKTTISLNQDDCSLEVVVDVDIVEGWHINSHVLPEGSFSIPTKRLFVFRAATPQEPLPIVKSTTKSFSLLKVLIKSSNNNKGFCVGW